MDEPTAFTALPGSICSVSSRMSVEIFKVLSPGLGITLQDQGPIGWRRFGVPPSGAMDDHAAGWANRLLDNPPTAAVLELLWQGAKLAVLHDAWIAVTGAESETRLATWRAVMVRTGDTIEFARVQSGLWSYIAVEGGFEGPRMLGSVSVYARGKLANPCAAGVVVHAASRGTFHLPAGVAGRVVSRSERRDYNSPPPLRVWPGPQWDTFEEAEREKFFTEPWMVTSQSDRAGYRLAGVQLKNKAAQIISEPVRVGSVQVPENGQPIVTMRDGPTVGGYPKIGLLDPQDVSWLAQSRPGQHVRFQLQAQSQETR
jgi:5-oxoprolinase (ATP-hydrolysing) subunit C